MPDELTPPVETAPAPEAPPAPPAPAPVSEAALDRLEALDRRMQAMGDTLQALATPHRPQGQAANPSDPNAIDPQVRQYLRAQGLSDADIANNFSLIQPFISAAIAQVGGPLAYELQSIRGEIETVKAGGNRKDFPDWDTVAGEVTKLQALARNQGRALSLQDAYNAAVAANIDSVMAARTQRRAASPAADAAAQAVHNVGRRADTTANAQPSADEIRRMTPEQRQAFWDRVGTQRVN